MLARNLENSMATLTTRTNPLSFLADQLDDLKQKGTYFKLRVLEDEQAPTCTFDGKKVIHPGQLRAPAVFAPMVTFNLNCYESTVTQPVPS
jgi:hypothetical protein